MPVYRELLFPMHTFLVKAENLILGDSWRSVNILGGGYTAKQGEAGTFPHVLLDTGGRAGQDL